MDEEKAQRLTARRVRIGISVRQLAEEADVDRGRLSRLLRGDPTVRDTTLGKVETALTRLEHEMGLDAPDDAAATIEQIEFTVEGDFGVKVTVKGPITDRRELEASVANIIRSIRESSPPTREG